LPYLARSPAGNIKEAIIHREIDVCHKRRYNFEVFEYGRQIIRIGRLRRNLNHFPDIPIAIVAIPQPDRTVAVLRRSHPLDEAIGFRRVMSWSKLKYQLLLRPQIERLLMPSTTQIPDMNAAPIFATEENLRFQPFLKHVGSPPFAGDHRVVTEMPPEVIGQVLWSPVHFPLSKHL